MSFKKFFKAASYATVACGAATLAASGGLSLVLGLSFSAFIVLAWLLEGRRWQLPERVGLAVIVISIPLFYLDWRQHDSLAGGTEAGAGVEALVRLTLFLSVVKLLQKKSDRDWLFLYLISFFDVLLAAGLVIGPVFLVALGAYFFFALLALILFDLGRAGRGAPHKETQPRVTYASEARRKKDHRRGGDVQARALRRAPYAALFLLALVFAFALPIFFITPRFGSRPVSLAAGAGATGYVGFSDRVSLGDIGRLQQSDRLVMRVRVEDEGAARGRALRWRGISLDNFDGRAWRRSSNDSQTLHGSERDFFQIGTTEDLERLTTQSFFIEPIDTPVLFAAPRLVAVEGSLDYLKRYADGESIATRPHPREFISYRAYSDTHEPPADALRSDMRPYPNARTRSLQTPVANYLQLPEELDERIAALTSRIVKDSGARNRYDAARAIEAHLGRNSFGGSYRYSLDMRVGGADPLADFLFNVREGHCEYYASAMTVMLRTVGVAARVVNGFQAGEYNPSAGAYFVRQYDAHSWVEVYFPETDTWASFDPTPVDGRPGAGDASGLRANLRRYAEAFELFWVQYVVAYDRQEQRTLAANVREKLNSLQATLLSAASALGSRVSRTFRGGDTSGESGGGYIVAQILVAAFSIGFILFVCVRRGLIYARRRKMARAESAESSVLFYERMLKALESRGLMRASNQTPLEFASATGLRDALTVTLAFNRVRFGAQRLSEKESEEIEKCLRRIEEEFQASEKQRAGR